MTNQYILELSGVKKYFPVKGGIFKTEKSRINVLNGITLNIPAGKIVGLAGESGCGKSTLAKLLVKLMPVSSGEILFRRKALNDIKGRDRKKFYQDVQMVFQDPYSSLNPRLKVKSIIGEMLRIRGINKEEERARLAKVLDDVKLDQDVVNKYPHEFSGGQRQRVAIARALVVRPKLLIADEPVSALDLPTQARILTTLKELKRKYHLTILFISHDLNMMAGFCDQVVVMYMGRIMEHIAGSRLFTSGNHPYLRALLSSIPVSDPAHRKEQGKIISGEVPDAVNLPTGCVFHTRCPEVFSRCKNEVPRLHTQKEQDHRIACHLFESYVS